MPESVKVGAEAPNFDLASTEGVVLMLCDEVPRSPLLLYFCPEVESASAQFELLKSLEPALASARVRLIVISEAALGDLQKLQREQDLPFPLLHDDRGFSRLYGVGEEHAEALVLVGRDQRISWLEHAPSDLRAAIGSALVVARKAPPSTSSYPRSVINRVVDRWVN